MEYPTPKFPKGGIVKGVVEIDYPIETKEGFIPAEKLKALMPEIKEPDELAKPTNAISKARK